MAMAQGRLAGSVKFYDPDKAYGFVTRDDGQGDVFIHKRELKRGGCDNAQKGDRITFEIEPGHDGKGLRAKEIAKE